MKLFDTLMDQAGVVVSLVFGLVMTLIILSVLAHFGVGFWVSAAVVLGLGLAFLVWEAIWDRGFSNLMSKFATQDDGEVIRVESKRNTWIGNYGVLLGIVLALILSLFIAPSDVLEWF